jgi:MFS family permease
LSYLSNDAINRVNLHCGILALAKGAGGAFVLVFLLKAGVSVPLAMMALGLIVAFRFLVRPGLMPLAKRVGLKPLLLFGTVALAAQYPLLADVHGAGWMLLILCIVESLAEVFYWVSFNTMFSMLGDEEHRGHQVSAREALVAVVNIVAPLLGAGALVTFGAHKAFAAVAFVQILSVIPLLGLPNIRVSSQMPGALRAAWPGIVIATVDGWMDTFFLSFWQIALFVSLGESYADYGGALALAGFVGAAGGLVLGRHVDRGHARRTILIAYGVLTVVTLLRAASIGSPHFATIANALGAIAMVLISPVLGIVSNLAKASPCPFRFHMGTEAGWDVGCFAACVCSAGLVAAGASFTLVMLFTLPAIVAEVVVLWKLYAPERSVGPTILPQPSK